MSEELLERSLEKIVAAEEESIASESREADSSLNSVISSHTVSGPDPVTSPDPMMSPDPVTGSDQVTNSDPVMNSDQVTNSDPVTGSDQVTNSDPVMRSDPITSPDPVTDPGTAARPVLALDPASRSAALEAESVELAEGIKNQFRQLVLGELHRHRVPLVIILALIVFPPFLPLWVLLIVLWSATEFVFAKLPENMQARIKESTPTFQKLQEFSWMKDLAVGVSQVRPFILFFTYIACAPVSLLWMIGHWIKSFRRKDEEKTELPADNKRILILQNKQAVSTEQETNFFHSPAFALTILVVFCSGLPAAISYFLYFNLGIDALMGMPSRDPHFTAIFTVIGLYIASLGACLSVLFLRAWFTFPTNFLGNERVVEFNEKGIKRHSPKGWFTTVLTLNTPWEGAESIDWSDVTQLVYNSGTGMKFYPLPEHPFDANSAAYKLFNKMAAIADGVIDRIGRAEFIEFKSKDGSAIKLNLWELNGTQRAQVFYAVRKWAAHVQSDLRVQEKMLGSTVLAEPRYTQIWFDLLSSSQKRQRTSTLKSGDKLRDGSVTVKQRIGTGGQATVYSAELADGASCVLKEFVLSSADTVGALIESAADFDNEAGLLSRLSHSGIVKLIDVFTEDRRVYLILEEVQGKSLRQIVQNAQAGLPESEVKDIALQVAEVLKYLHEQDPPLVHRDVSPDNLVLTPEGEVKLIDFSLATRAARRDADQQTTTSITRSGCVGKFGYTPPEQFREEVLPQSDIYALGGTLHYLLTGKDPKPLTQSAPASIIPELSAKMDSIVRRATELEASARYEDMSWMILDLKNCNDD